MPQTVSVAQSFLPVTLEGWLTIITIVGTATFAFWNANRSAREKINGLGRRVKEVEDGCTKNNTAIDRIDRDTIQALTDRKYIHERLGGVEKAQEESREAFMEFRLEMVAHFSEMKRLFSERDTKLRERLVRLETVSQIEKKLGRPLTELIKEDDD